MRFIVTGASSFIGSAVVKKLKEEGHKVTEFRHSFEEDEDDLPHRADIWLHFAWAGVGSKDRADDEVQGYNIGMSMAALEKAIELNCKKFIFAGSQAEYGRAQDGGLKKEELKTEPVSAYGDAKLMFSKLAATRLNAYNREEDCPRPVRYIHMRLFSVYGPGDHEGSLINTLIDKLSAGEKTELGSCGQSWDYMYIDDAVEAVYTLCTKFTGGTYNIGSGDIRPLRDYVREAADIILSSGNKAADADGLLIFGAREDNAEGAADLSPDITKLKELGFTPKVSFAEGMRRTIAARLNKKA